MNKEYNYDDIYLIPQKCNVDSRSECDISVQLGKHTFANPVIAANMKSVVNVKTCMYLASKNMFYIMHRFDTDMFGQTALVELMRDNNLVASISIGVKEEDYETIHHLNKENAIPDYITIDVAHGHCKAVYNMIQHIKSVLPDTFVIAGNIATAEAVEYLQEAGVDALKYGIGPGRACTSKLKTGFTRSTVTGLQECTAVSDIPIIADGGIRHCGDIAKAMACGATMVMVGSFLSGYDQNSGDIITVNGHKKYVYYGSASFNNKQSNKHVEGTEVLLDYKGNMDNHIYDIECSLKSSVSYAGVKKIEDMNRTPFAVFN